MESKSEEQQVNIELVLKTISGSLDKGALKGAYTIDECCTIKQNWNILLQIVSNYVQQQQQQKQK